MSAPRKLTDEQVKEIRAIYRLAERVRKERGHKHHRTSLQTEIASHFGISARLVLHIRPKKAKSR